MRRDTRPADFKRIGPAADPWGTDAPGTGCREDERILAAAPALASVAKLMRSSHERFDGTGYPDGLGGQAIPLGARIVSACDAWDAMITKWSYRTALSHREALVEMRRCSGTQFDPDVVEALCAEVTGGRELSSSVTAGTA